MLKSKLKNSITASISNTQFKSQGTKMAKVTEEDLDFTEQNSKRTEVVDDNHFMVYYYGLSNRRPMISKMINSNHISLIILDSILLNGLTYLPFIFGGTLKFDASITPTTTCVSNPLVLGLADRQVPSVIHLPFDENSGARDEVLDSELKNSVANSSSDTQLKLQGLKLAEVTEEDLHSTDLPFIFGETQTLDDLMIPRPCFASVLPVSKLADPHVLSMIIMPCDTSTGNPIPPIPNANNVGRNYGNGNGGNRCGSGSWNGGSNGRNDGNAANNFIPNWFLPINIHKYEGNYTVNGSILYHRKVGLTIPTNIVPSRYHSWESFAGAIYRFSISQIGVKSPIINTYQVRLDRGIEIHPRECWPAFQPYFGVFANGVFYSFNYHAYPWNTAKLLVRDVVVISLFTRRLHAPE